MQKNELPNHIVLVPDGNRRFAKQKGLVSSAGHQAGADVFRNVLTWSKELGIKELTFWCMSTENLKRDKVEVEFLFKLFDKMCDELIDKCSKGKAEPVKINYYGALHLLPTSLVAKLHKVEDLTKHHTEYTLNFLIAYGGREELVQAAKKLANEVASGKLKAEDIDESAFAKKLYLQSEPDLIIRTGHACMSGLLPWQSVYSEIIFLDDVFWPEFSKEILQDCLEVYACRVRNYGK